MKLKRTFKVTGLVLVDDIELGQLVQHGSNLREQCLGGTLLRRVAQRLHGITGRLVIKAVVCTLRDRLTDPLIR